MQPIKNFFYNISAVNFGYGLLANFLAALLIGGVFFLLRDNIFKYPDINGRYFLKKIIKETSYKPYEKMELHFILHLSSANGNLIGGGERVYEDSSYGKKIQHVIHFTGDSKIPIKINGNVTKKIFSRDVINIFCEVQSKSRASNMALTIEAPFFQAFQKIRKRMQFSGKFTWSVAEKSGEAFLSTNPFPQKPSTENKNNPISEKSILEANNDELHRQTNNLGILHAKHGVTDNGESIFKE